MNATSSYAKFENTNNNHETVVEIVQTDGEGVRPNKVGFFNPVSHHNGVVHEQQQQQQQQGFDHIEVSLVEDDGAAKPEEVLTNATDFLFEHNDNYQPSWEEAADRLSDCDVQLDEDTLTGYKLHRVRLRRIIQNLYFRLFTLLLILIDVVIVIVDLAKGDGSFSSLQIIDFVITLYFVFELGARIFALTHPVFFSAWYNVVDFAVILSTFIVVCVSAASKEPVWTENLQLLIIFRFVRVFRLARLCTEKKQLEAATRQLVSQNKRRYQQDGFDLDLTYVTARIIATSFPSSGLWAYYRNPIERVAKFLDAKHAGHYRLYNLCSERSYDISHFHGRVKCIPVDDHNVPTLGDMLHFAQSVKDWLNADPDNVAVVHCKGGKGRTGTMICVWLVEAGIFSNAKQSLEYFGRRRTDSSVSRKFQGVETPSQSRYVCYFETMKREHGGCLPPSVPLTISKVEIRGLGRCDDYWFEVKSEDDRVFSAHLGYQRNCKVTFDSSSVTAEVLKCPTLVGDVRVLFQSSSKLVPRGYEHCPFYLWFNTSFVETEMLLSRDELDNPHKEKTWNYFREDFMVKFWFTRVESNVTH